LSITKAGLRGCGPEIAHALSRYGIGESLLDFARMAQPSELLTFLIGWREELRVLLSTDPLGYLGRQYVKLANSIPNNFPSTSVVLSYARPVTSWSSGGPVPQPLCFPAQAANFAQLAYLCQHNFAWDTATIHKKFNAVIWEGACLRMLCDVGIPFALSVSSNITSE
jgi:Holliday junction resolvase YEN1